MHFLFFFFLLSTTAGPNDSLASIRKPSESTYILLESIDHNLDGIETLCPLDIRNRNNGKHSYFHTSTFGILEQLPLELMNMTLIQLDIQSLTTSRRVNRRAMQVVDQIPQYKKIILHARSSIQGILRISAGNSFSCQYETLHSSVIFVVMWADTCSWLHVAVFVSSVSPRRMSTSHCCEQMRCGNLDFVVRMWQLYLL